MIFERYSFVAVTTRDLARARGFWADQLGCPITEEEADHFFIVDAGGLRLCVDLADGDVHRAGSTDPVIGLKVADVEATMRALADRGIRIVRGPVDDRGGRWAEIRDPDGRAIIISETD